MDITPLLLAQDQFELNGTWMLIIGASIILGLLLLVFLEAKEKHF